MKGMAAFGLGIFLFIQPVSVAAGVPGDQVRETSTNSLRFSRILGSNRKTKKMSDARSSRS